MKAYELMRENQRDIDSDKLEQLLEDVRWSSLRAKVPLIPKFHLMRHFGSISRHAGNPEGFAEHKDEDYNRVMVRLAQAACTPEFGAAILARARLYYRTLHEVCP